MKAKIYGIDTSLDFSDGDIALMNIHNKDLYRKLCEFMLFRLNEDDNEFVILDDENERIKGKNILYINDLLEFQLDNNKVLKAIIKRYMSFVSMDNEFKERQNAIYNKLLEPFLDEMNLL